MSSPLTSRSLIVRNFNYRLLLKENYTLLGLIPVWFGNGYIWDQNKPKGTKKILIESKNNPTLAYNTPWFPSVKIFK